jgi:FtsH-binding integral membrane protein
MMRLVRALPRALLGYLASSVLVTLLVFFFLTGGTTGSGADDTFLIGAILFMFVVLLTAVPFLMVFAYSEIRRINRPGFFALTGTMTGLLIYLLFGSNSFFDPEELAMALIGGLGGGLTYWSVSGRRAGS